MQPERPQRRPGQGPATPKTIPRTEGGGRFFKMKSWVSCTKSKGSQRSVRVPLWAGDVLEVWTMEARVTRGSHGKNGKGPLFRPRPFYPHRQGGVSDQDEETERSRRVGHMSEPKGVSGPTDPLQNCPILESHTGPEKCQNLQDRKAPLALTFTRTEQTHKITRDP